MDIKKWNEEELKKNGFSAPVRPYSRVRSLGDLKKATLWDETVVERQDYLYVGGYGMVKCCPYELHFIYKVPDSHYGWGLMCTCGSIAGVVGYKAYSKLMLPTSTGQMIVCLRHNTLKDNEGIGRHADGSTE